MSDRELRDELVTVIGAGHETTATALAWAFERLLRNPSVLEQLEQSLSEGDTDPEATIKETLRVRPVILDTARRVTRDIELGGYRIPAGGVGVAEHRRGPLPGGPLSGPGRVPPRTFPRAAAEDLYLDPVRRRGASVRRRLIRAVRRILG